MCNCDDSGGDGGGGGNQHSWKVLQWHLNEIAQET